MRNIFDLEGEISRIGNTKFRGKHRSRKLSIISSFGGAEYHFTASYGLAELTGTMKVGQKVKAAFAIFSAIDNNNHYTTLAISSIEEIPSEKEDKPKKKLYRITKGKKKNAP